MKIPINLKKFLRRLKRYRKTNCKKIVFVPCIIFFLLFAIIASNDEVPAVEKESDTCTKTDNEFLNSFSEGDLNLTALILPLNLNTSFLPAPMLENILNFDIETKVDESSKVSINDEDNVIDLEDSTLPEESTEVNEDSTLVIDDNSNLNSYINQLINYYSSYDTRIELNYDNIYLLGRLAIAESEGESFKGRVAVCEVAINRALTYNLSIYEVIFARNRNGSPQFTCVDDGRINLTPRNEDILAAVTAIIGEQPTNGSLFFDNPTKSPNSWASRNRIKSIKIEHHQFYY